MITLAYSALTVPAGPRIHELKKLLKIPLLMTRKQYLWTRAAA